MSCRLSSCARPWRLLLGEAARPARPARPAFLRLASNTASSTSSSAPPASTSQRTGEILEAMNELHNPERPSTLQRKKREPASLSLAQIRDAMVDALGRRHPRKAMQIYLEVLARRGDNRLSSRTVDGFAWLFCQYRQPALARQAAAAMQEQGYIVTPRLASRLLRISHHDLLLQPDVLAKVLGWISEGIVREKKGGKDVDEGMLETVLDVLKRMGRSDWLLDVFKAYRGTLDAGQAGSARLWAIAISAKTNEGDVRTAQKLFSEWRALYVAQRRMAVSRCNSSSITPPPAEPPPPPDPYLALLHHFSVGTTYIAARDPAYKLVAVATEHGLAPSTDYLNALLRTELHRKRWTSFWGLWAQFDALSLARDPSSWSLAIKAKLWHDVARRQRGRLHASPLHGVAPFAYAEQPAPPARALFRAALAARLHATGHRPSRALSTKQPDALGPATLNAFLELFVSRGDFSAAAVALETFGVHRFEPDARTHAAVVLGVVRLWERGRLRAELLDRDSGGGNADPYDEAAQERRRRRAAMGGPQGVELIRRILEGRKMRVGLWTGPPAGEETAAEEGGLPVEEEEKEDAPPSAPAWMAQREMRELGYLATLLRRCAGLSEAEWGALMAKTRVEMLPERTSGKAKKVRTIDHAARHREYTYGKATKAEGK
ncbi:hypothetical protein JCM10449v2_001908 [Rhodotorula kratochvilovae]